jgi:uncharacterized protein YeaO (DUF488 family)
MAPTLEMVTAFKYDALDWPEFKRQFQALLTRRGVQEELAPEALDRACLLCSEPSPTRCHRRLVAEYLKGFWPHIQIRHIE